MILESNIGVKGICALEYMAVEQISVKEVGGSQSRESFPISSGESVRVHTFTHFVII